MVFVDEVDIEVLVHAEPILNVTTLTCRLHDVVIQGSYVMLDSGEERIKCTIPSVQFLRVNSEVGFPLSEEFVVEVSVNSVHFSDDGLTFKFIENN